MGLLVFALNLFFFFILIFNLNCWFGIHISWSLDLIFFCLFCGLIITLKNWFRDLLRELNKKYEILLMVLFLVFFLFLFSEVLLFVSFFWAAFHSFSSPTLGVWPGEGFYVPDLCELTFANTLLLSNAAVSLGGAFVSLEISCSFLIFFSLFSFILAWTFISLQIIEFRIMGLSINDSFYSCVFFFLTGLHFFHLVLGLLLISLLLWSCGFSFISFLSSFNISINCYLVSTFIGILLTFSSMHFLGFNVMPRRIPDFPDSFHSWNFLSSIGSGITFLSFAM